MFTTIQDYSIEEPEQLISKNKHRTHEKKDESSKPQIPIPYPHTAFAFWSPIGSLTIVHNNQTIKNYRDHHEIDNEKDLNNYIYAPQKKIQVELQELNKNKDQNLIQDFQDHTDGIKQDFSEQGMKILADVDDDDYDYLTLNIQSSQTYFKNFKPDVTIQKSSHKKDKKQYDFQVQQNRNAEYEAFDLSNNMVLFETFKTLIKNSQQKEKRVKNQNSTVSIYDFSIYNYQIYEPFKKVSELFVQKLKKKNSEDPSTKCLFQRIFQQQFGLKESKILGQFAEGGTQFQSEVFECEFLTIVINNVKEKLLSKSRGLLLLEALIDYLIIQLESSMNQIYFKKQLFDFFSFFGSLEKQISDSLRTSIEDESINIDSIIEKVIPFAAKIPINTNNTQKLLIEQNQKQFQNQDAPIMKSVKSKINTTINVKYLVKTIQYLTINNFDQNQLGIYQKQCDPNLLENFTFQQQNDKKKAQSGLSLILSNLSHISQLEYIIAQKQIFQYFKSVSKKKELTEVLRKVCSNAVKSLEGKIKVQQDETQFDCSICQMKIVFGQVIVCPKCSHGGHYEHVISWFQNKLKCPKCFECQCFFLADVANFKLQNGK